MTLDEFISKFNLSDRLIDDFRLIDVLDIFYLEFTEEQTINIIKTYFANADSIQNDIMDTIKQHLEK